MKREDTLASLSPEVMIPTDIEYTFRCVEESFSPSKSSGNMMITREWELDSPSVVTINEKQYGISGIKQRSYLVTMKSDGRGGWDEAGTKQAMGRVYDDYDKLSPSGTYEGEIDPANPILIAKGKLARWTMRNDKFEFTEELTPADIAAGKKQGKVVMIDGKPKTGFKPALGYLQGLAS